MGTLAGLGLGFLFVLLILGAIREIGGNGTFLGIQLLENGPAPSSLLMVVPGGLLLLSGLTAFSQWLRNRARRRKGVVES
jgi:electron transport complex protein RnfE